MSDFRFVLCKTVNGDWALELLEIWTQIWLFIVVFKKKMIQKWMILVNNEHTYNTENVSAN